MSSKMRAFVMKGIGKVGIMEKEIPTPGPNDAIIKTTTALVCTSDVHTVAGAIGDRKNLTLGHEACGIVHEVGEAVTMIKPGDRVVVGAITPCYKCVNCVRGFTSQCKEMLGGWKYANIKDGIFADYFHVNDADSNLAIIPDDVSDEAACYVTDMISTGFKGAENADIPLGGTAAVFGLGAVGLMGVVGCRLQGAAVVIGVDNDPKRLELAKEYGADIVINFDETDAVEEIKTLTEGFGVDASLEAVGAQITFENCIKATRPGGTIANMGYHGSGEYIKIPRAEWGVGMSDKTIKTQLCPGGKVRMRRMLRLLRNGRVDPTKMTTHRFTFAEIEDAYQLMASKEDNVIKPLVSFT